MAEKVVNQNQELENLDEQLLPEIICKYSDDIKPSDISIRKFSVNMGMKNKNPLASVSFYKVEGNQA